MTRGGRIDTDALRQDVRRVLRSLRMDQYQLAAVLDLSPSQLSRILSGRSRPSAKAFADLVVWLVAQDLTDDELARAWHAYIVPAPGTEPVL